MLNAADRIIELEVSNQDSASACLTNDGDLHTIEKIRNVRLESDICNAVTDVPKYKNNCSINNGYRNIRCHIELVGFG